MIEEARRVIENAIRDRVFPAAALEVGSSTGPLRADAFGTLTFDRGSSPTGIGTPFDLASLTKVIATTTVLMQLVGSGRLRLDERVVACFPDWRGGDREPVTIRDLLEHASGLSARLVDSPPVSRREFEHDICTMRLEYAPRTQAVYSDLGFILLGFLAADRGGASLAAQFNAIRVRLKPDTTYVKSDQGSGSVRPQPDVQDSGSVGLQADLLTFGLAPDARRLAAPTLPMADDSRRGRALAGEVHDNYAAALGGVAGHAGLFGTATSVGAFARVVLRATRDDAGLPEPFTAGLVRQFTTKSSMPGSSRALGWDTMQPTSSCGTRMSASAFGHVGFTGTSLWVDPGRDRYFVLLTNRVCGGGTPDQMRTVRRAFHDALGDF